jgi:hypothetical protein
MSSFRKISFRQRRKEIYAESQLVLSPQKKQIGFRINSPLRAEFSGMTEFCCGFVQRSQAGSKWLG